MTTDMTTKVNFLAQHAATLIKRGQRMAVPSLAETLNSQGLQTSYGTSFSGERGTYTLLRAAYRRLVNGGRQTDADNIAGVYTQPNGSHAWDK